jgi:hypothetical protein
MTSFRGIAFPPGDEQSQEQEILDDKGKAFTTSFSMKLPLLTITPKFLIHLLMLIGR